MTWWRWESTHLKSDKITLKLIVRGRWSINQIIQLNHKYKYSRQWKLRIANVTWKYRYLSRARLTLWSPVPIIFGFSFFYSHFKYHLSCMLKIKSDISISKIRKWLTTILSNLNNFHSLEVVDRVSETQLQVSENFHQIIWQWKSWYRTKVTFVNTCVRHNYTWFVTNFITKCRKVSRKVWLFA